MIFFFVDDIYMTLLKILIVIAGYAITIGFSGKIVKLIIGPGPEKKNDSSNKLRFDLGAIIGKCENLLTNIYFS